MDMKKRFVRLFSEVVDEVSDTKPKKDIVYYDTHNTDFEEAKKYLIMERQEMGEDIDEDDIDDEMVWDRISLDNEDDYYNFMGEVKAFDKKNGGVGYVAKVHCGLWNRSVDGYIYKEFLEDMVKEIFDHDSIMDWRVAFEDGDLCITGYHHDGRNWAIIRRVGEDEVSKQLKEEYTEEEDDLSAEEEDELLGEIYDRGTSVLI